MLDVIAPGAAVFEPEEVDILTAACSLALKKIERSDDDADAKAEVAKLVHNLGRSRLRHRKRLKDAADAASLAEEAADLLGYLRKAPDLDVSGEARAKPSDRAVPFFPAEVRSPPTSLLRPRTPGVALTPAATANTNAARATATSR